MDATDLCFTPATELSRLIDRREVSPVEIVDAVLDRIDRLNPRLSAFITVTAELARERARSAEARALRGERIGPLDGVPYSLKDLEPTAGVRTTFGSKFFEQNIPERDGVTAERMQATGAILLGKTNTSHYGYKDMCDNLIVPPCRNPWRLDRTSGASSGGAGAAVAAGLGPLAHGTDGAGSIRIPAALCGVVGFKPSLGRVPYYPSADLFATRAHGGPLTRTVADAALMLGALAGPDPRDPLSIDAPPEDYLAALSGGRKGLRVAWSPDLGFALAVDPAVRAIAGTAARRFADLGCSVEEPAIDWPNPRDFHKTIWEVAYAGRIGDAAVAKPEWIEPTLLRMILNAGRVSAVDYNRALLARTAYYEAVRSFFDRYDLLLTPGMPITAWDVTPGSDEGPKERDSQPPLSMFDRLPFTYPFNLTGQPAIVVPAGFAQDGMPVALQIVGRWHADAAVLRAAAAFEAVQPWAAARPPLDPA